MIKPTLLILTLGVLLLSCKKESYVRIETLGPSDITLTSATCGGYVSIYQGDPEIHSRGICYGLDSFPTLDDQFVVCPDPVDAGAFKCELTNLLPDTIYYIRPYVEYDDQIIYDYVNVSFRTAWTIGNRGPAGGFVFWVDSDGNGLEISPFDIDSNKTWGCPGIFISGAASEYLYDGEANTSAIVADCSDPNTPAQICQNFSYNGFDDWYLPTRSELHFVRMFLYERGKGDFITHDAYWSSTNLDADRAWAIALYNYDYTASKIATCSVRAVRAF